MRSADHCFTHYVNFNIQEDDLTEENLKAINIIVKSSNLDLRRGDLISIKPQHGYRNNDIAIYDGVNVISLENDIDDYGYVPKQFKVIQEFPIQYWSDDPDNLDLTKRGIDHNCIVWFDHNIVKDQCLMNINFRIINDGKFGAVTQFNYNNKIYYIILHEGEDKYEDFLENNTAVAIQQLKDKLLGFLNSDCTMFESESNVYLNPDNNILFTPSSFSEDF